jgi:hypothetical protein
MKKYTKADVSEQELEDIVRRYAELILKQAIPLR